MQESHEYEAPDLFELGDVSELTLGRRFGDVNDGGTAPRDLMFIPMLDDSLGED